MSTIPITFNRANETLPAYTVIGGRENLDTTGLSVVLLNRGGRYARRSLFGDLKKIGFDSVVSVEPAPAHYDIDELSSRFPFVRFVLLQGALSLGEQINLAASELDSPLFFVLWNDLRLLTGGTARRMADRLTRTAEDIGSDTEKSKYKRLCTVPVMQNSRFETLPTLMIPALHRKKVRTLSLRIIQEGLPGLYPFDGVGIYDRERFIRLGGYDGTFKSNYWQLMDFGFRASLWGEEISATQSLKLMYESAVSVEDYSDGKDVSRFYLKNLAPVFRNDYASLPLSRFPGYLLQTSCGILSAWENFSDCRRWVTTNRYRWRCDLRTVTNRWGVSPAEDTSAS